MIGAVVMSMSNVSPSLLAVALHTFKPLWWWERDLSLFSSKLFQLQCYFMKAMEPVLMSYISFFPPTINALSSHIIMDSCGSGLGMWVHITLGQFLNSSSVPCFIISLDSSLPGCSAQSWPASSSHPLCSSVLSSRASQFLHPLLATHSLIQALEDSP